MTSSQRRYAELSALAGVPVPSGLGLGRCPMLDDDDGDRVLGRGDGGHPCHCHDGGPTMVRVFGGGHGGGYGYGAGYRDGRHGKGGVLRTTGRSFLKGFGGTLGVVGALWLVGGWLGRKVARSAEAGADRVVTVVRSV